MAWVATAIAGVGILNAVDGSGQQQSSNSSGFNGPDTAAANNGWLSAYTGASDIANQTQQNAQGGYANSLAMQNAINYQPSIQAGQQAGQTYGQLANTAAGQATQLGANAQQAQGQATSLYAAGQQLYNQAFDPNQAQFNQSQQNLTNQVNAGQAARGLGNSAVGAQESNQANQNFDIAWNTQQLANESTGIQGMATANNAGGSQAQLANQDYAGQLSTGAQGAGYQQQAAGVPLAAQQNAAAAPGAAAATYAGQMSGLQNQQNTQAATALPYITGGQGATNVNNLANTAANTATTQAIGNGLGAVAGSAGTSGTWLNNLFGGSSSGYNAGTVAPTSSDVQSLYGSTGYG
jgi:hypothetical protein